MCQGEPQLGLSTVILKPRMNGLHSFLLSEKKAPSPKPTALIMGSEVGGMCV